MPPDPQAAAVEAARQLAARTGVARHDVAIVLGSGWGGVADALGPATAELPQHELGGFPKAAVDGHGGTLRSVATGRHRVLVFLGRTHLYEGHGVDVVVHPVRTAVAAGCGTVVLTNACGGIRADLRPGQPVLVSDHISFTGVSPLRGPQFVDLTGLYSHRLRRLCREIDGTLTEGVYGHWPGPAYETPAEIQMLRTLGCDLVGMSTVPEAIAAHALGAEVLAIALVTNLAAGLGAPPRHDEVLREGKRATERLAGILAAFLDRLEPRAVDAPASGTLEPR